jgi:transcriptional regulator with XRE-family HTH domain
LDYNKIKKLIALKNISIKRFFEEQIGMTENGFHQAVRNHTLKVRDLEKISRELGVPVSYWFEEDENVPIENAAAERGIDYLPAYRDMREELIITQRKMIDYLEQDNNRLKNELNKCLEEMHGRGVG